MLACTDLGLVLRRLVLHVDPQLAGLVTQTLVTGLQLPDSPPDVVMSQYCHGHVTSPHVLHSDPELLGLHHGPAVVTLLVGQGSLQVSQLTMEIIRT